VIELSKAREQSENSESRLGQAWRLLNPLLNTAVYFLVFGIIFKGRGTVPNYIAFLVIGVFFFTYTQQSVLGGSRSIVSNMTLVRALNFPRALLPVSAVIEEFYTLIPAIMVSVAIVLLTHEGISVWWLMLLPALILQTMFNLGLAMILARMTERVRDVQKLLPFVMRTWLYLSGVVFPIGKLASEHAPWVGFLASFNPAAVYIELARDCLLTTYTVPPITWAYAVFWAVLTLGGGFVYFWAAEERYGRG
jgi:teichoic acid transport system permease protein